MTYGGLTMSRILNLLTLLAVSLAMGVGPAAAAETQPGAAGLLPEVHAVALVGQPVPESEHEVNRGRALATATAEPQIFGGWFGNWHSPQIVTARVDDGAGLLTDTALFAWDFAGKRNPVCALTFHSGCVPASAKRPWQSRETATSFAAMQATTRWVSHIDLNSDRAGELASVLKSPSRRDALTDKLTAWTVAIDADGLDLDWENFAFNDGSHTWRATRPAFVAAVKQLAGKLHAEDRLLSVTVPAGSRPFGPDGQPRSGSGYTVYDWAAIADSVDRLNLMTYDYSWDKPGPIGPAPWAAEVVRSAIAQMGRDNARKIVVGAPLYGKSWPTVGSDGRQVTVGKCPASWRASSVKAVFSVTPSSARQLAAAEGTRPRFDRTSKEYTFSYAEPQAGKYRVTVGSGKKQRTERRSRTCAVSRTVWFADTASVNGRASMAKEQGIGGVFMWSLASTSPGLYRSYERHFG